MSDGIFWYLDASGNYFPSLVPLPSRTVVVIRANSDAEAVDALIATTNSPVPAKRSWWRELLSRIFGASREGR